MLSRAYVQQIVSALPKPTADEIKKYYNDHPALFAERPGLQPAGDHRAGLGRRRGLAQVRALAAANKPLEEIVNLLKSRNIKFGGGRHALSRTDPAGAAGARSAPSGQPDRCHRGQTGLHRRARGGFAVRPVAEAAATAPHRAVPDEPARRRAVTQQMKQLRAKASITYMGDFARAAAGPAAAPAQPATTLGTNDGAPAAPPPRLRCPARRPAARHPADAKGQAVIEKGVAAMK